MTSRAPAVLAATRGEDSQAHDDRADVVDSLLRARRRPDRTRDESGLRSLERQARRAAARHDAAPLAPARTRVVLDPDTRRPRRVPVAAVPDPMAGGYRDLSRQYRAILDSLAPLFAATADLRPLPRVERSPDRASRTDRDDDQRAPGHPPSLTARVLLAAPNAPGR